MRLRNLNQLLSDILTNIEAALEYVGSCSFEEFESNDMMVVAVEKRLENASEAARWLHKQHPDTMQAIKQRHPNVPWERFRGFSSVSRHDYDLIDVEAIWRELQPNGNFRLVEEAVQNELPLSQVISKDNPR